MAEHHAQKHADNAFSINRKVRLPVSQTISLAEEHIQSIPEHNKVSNQKLSEEEQQAFLAESIPKLRRQTRVRGSSVRRRVAKWEGDAVSDSPEESTEEISGIDPEERRQAIINIPDKVKVLLKRQ